MGNQQKAEFVSDDFGIQSFWGGHDKLLSKTLLMSKGIVCPEIPIQQPGRVPTTVTHKLLTIWICIMDDWKDEIIVY
jgi:hypothetical protein